MKALLIYSAFYIRCNFWCCLFWRWGGVCVYSESSRSGLCFTIKHTELSYLYYAIFVECFASVFVYVPYACIVNIYKKAAREEPLFLRVEN